MYKKLQHIQIKVIDLGEKNKCIGKLDNGIVVIIEGIVAIGDIVEAKIIKIKKNYLTAKLVKIIKSSNTRVKPKCKYFGICGGCKWQHIHYDEQKRLKLKQVQDALLHIGGFDIICDFKEVDTKIFQYRNKIDLSFTDLRYLSNTEIETKTSESKKRTDFALGFHPANCYSKSLDIDDCLLATEEMNIVLNIVRLFCLKYRNELPIYSTRSHTGELRNLVIRQGGNSNELMINLITSNHNKKLMKKLYYLLYDTLEEKITTFINSTTSAKNSVAVGTTEYIIYGNGFITDAIHNYKFHISANSFFQTNTLQAEELYKIIINIGKFNKSEIVYDLFCGTGSISISISSYCKKILGIEMVESSISDAKINAKINNVNNCSFIKSDVKNLSNLQSTFYDFGLPDVIIIDPPRAGIHIKGIEALLRLFPKKIIYVSCNPVSLARDAKIITEKKMYSLSSCTAIDLFPNTNHVECVAKFDRL